MSKNAFREKETRELPPDYLTAALARLRGAAGEAGFEVGEVTLSFDDMEEIVELKVRLSIEAGLLDLPPAQSSAMSTIPAAEKARRYRHKLVDLLEKAEAIVRPGAGKAELAALADEAHTVRTQLDVEERCEALRQSATSPSGAIGAPRPQSSRVLPEGED